MRNPPVLPDAKIALLTGGWDRPYAYGLTTALLARGVCLDLICGNDLDIQEFHHDRQVAVLNLRQETGPGATVVSKVGRLLLYYVRLIRYAWTARPRVFHILWNNRFETIDRVLLMLYYRSLGKQIALTVHNVNAGQRDGRDTRLNRLTLRCQYRLSHHIFVHTEKMKSDLIGDFGIRGQMISVIPFGINNAVPRTVVTRSEARQRLGISDRDKAILFFGNIAPYKGLEYLVRAFRVAANTSVEYRLIIAGSVKNGCAAYWSTIEAMIGDQCDRRGIILKIEYVPDQDTELYFKAADVLVLPYVTIFQSGVLLLGYSFGLPVLVADVGSLKEDIVEGVTGFVFNAEDSDDLARAIERYFASDLFKHLADRRQAIADYANAKHSWQAVADVTQRVYGDLLTS